MADEKQFKIDIPESIEGYEVTLFWGLTIRQIILVFIAVVFAGFAVFNLFGGRLFLAAQMAAVMCLSLLGIIEIRGRNFYRHLLFISTYYLTKPQVLIYSHYSASGKMESQASLSFYQKPSNAKIFWLIILSLAVGILLLILTGFYIYHVISK